MQGIASYSQILQVLVQISLLSTAYHSRRQNSVEYPFYLHEELLIVFKYPADKRPVTIILLLSALDFAIFFLVDSLWFVIAFWLLMIIPKAVISSWNHHHQHCHVFKRKWQNRVLEFFYALHTGVTTNLWVLHHNLGHHRNFLDQTKDESRWKDDDGSTMGVFKYILVTTLTAYLRGYQVGKNYPKQRRQFVVFSIITLLLLVALTIYDPINALFIFILPMIGSLIFTSWATYDHHTDLDTQDQFVASHNITNRWFNMLTGNLGYHTAHHYKQGVHWSKLPELHEEIKHKIPEECFSDHFLDFIDNLNPASGRAHRVQDIDL